MKLYQGSPHQWGQGKIHVVDDEDESNTFCGKRLAETPGKIIQGAEANCKSCATAIRTRADRDRYRLEYEERERQRVLQKAQEDAEWRARYNAHISSPEWKRICALVRQRARNMCEGCGISAAQHVHHTTYEHLGNELLFELLAVCIPCHERIHGRSIGAVRPATTREVATSLGRDHAIEMFRRAIANALCDEERVENQRKLDRLLAIQDRELLDEVERLARERLGLPALGDS